MRRFLGFVGAFCLLWALTGHLEAADFKLTNGEVIRGEAASFNDDGLIVRLNTGGFSPRISWGKLTQDTLRELLNNPQAKQFAEPFIEIPPEVKEQERKERKKEIVVREPEKPALPPAKGGFFASLMNPVGWFLLALLYAANLYAAFEVALFRGRPVALVVGLALVLPVIAPALFAALPSAHAAAYTPTEAAPVEAPAAEQKVAPGPAGMGLASHTPSGAGPANPVYKEVFSRSNTTFDRRFFETKYTGFFRVVPSDAEKDMVLVVKGAKAQYIARRISRISANEVHLQLQSGGSEVSIPFGEIVEVSVRHKDAK